MRDFKHNPILRSLIDWTARRLASNYKPSRKRVICSEIRSMLFVICHSKDSTICMYLGGRKYPDGKDALSDSYKVGNVYQWEAIHPTKCVEWSKSLLADHIEELLTAAYTGKECENKLYTLS